jgi:hypothetical protein
MIKTLRPARLPGPDESAGFAAKVRQEFSPFNLWFAGLSVAELPRNSLPKRNRGVSHHGQGLIFTERPDTLTQMFSHTSTFPLT